MADREGYPAPGASGSRLAMARPRVSGSSSSITSISACAKVENSAIAVPSGITAAAKPIAVMDRDLQHAHPAEAVRERAGKPAAERRGHDGDSADRAGGAGRHSPYRNDGGHDVAVQLLIEAVQGPAAPAGQHRAALSRGQIAQPGQHRVPPFG